MVNSVDCYFESHGGERESMYLSFIQHGSLEIVCSLEVIIVGLFDIIFKFPRVQLTQSSTVLIVTYIICEGPT